MKPQTCFLCSERDAVIVHDGWPLCDRCAEQANESAAERYYVSATVDEQQEGRR